MRTIEEIRQEIQEAEQDLFRLERDFSNAEFLGVDKNTYRTIQDKIEQLQVEISSDTIYIKTIYNQLVAIKSNAEFSLRRNNNQSAFEILGKVYQAFLMLIKYNDALSNKTSAYKELLNEREKCVQKSANQSLIHSYKKIISEKRQCISELRQELRDSESQHSKSAETKSRVITELQEYQNQLRQLDTQIKRIETWQKQNAPFCDTCHEKMVLSRKDDIFYKCPNWGKTKGSHKTKPYAGDKEQARRALTLLDELQQRRKEVSDNPPFISLSEEEKETLQDTSVSFDEYPLILETDYTNYLFQSLSVPKKISIKGQFDELSKHSRFRIFTKLPQVHEVDDDTRTVYSLALRLLNRGIVLSANEETVTKINRYMSHTIADSFLSSLTKYVVYQSPQNKYDSQREKEFAEYYFPKLFGLSWATYIYTQMPIELLVESTQKKQFSDQRVDFLICFDDQKIVIELDGEEHRFQPDFDQKRDDLLKQNGYIVKRFSNEDVDARSPYVWDELQKIVMPKQESNLVPVDEKHLVACKIVHQVSIALVKMLEGGHISAHCDLHIEISSDLFSVEEQNFLLTFAVEEVTELIAHFAQLYGVDFDYNFFDKGAESYWIKIGDGDNHRNSIVIRDIVLPINYLCSIHPFALIMPEKDSITEELLEYFLQYVYGYAGFRPGQFSAIRRTLRKEESIVLLPTGSGKSVIYQLSSMLLPGISVVISPLRALIEDQVNNLANNGINSVAAVFSTEKKSQGEMLKKARIIMENHSALMLYIAPERMQIPSFREEIKGLKETNNFCLIAIDEAHCVSEWGHEFRAAYLQIGRSCRRVFRKDEFIPPIVALTGTASDNVLRDVKRDLEIGNENAIITPSTFDRPELHYSIISCESEQKYPRIENLLVSEIPSKFGLSYDKFSELQGRQTNSGIIFTILAKKKDSQFSAWTLFNWLNQRNIGLQIGTYFSSVPPSLEGKDKEETWNCIIKSYAQEFKDNQKQLLVATKAFGMGIDKSNIRYVIHSSLPNSIEQYYQEVGRAGRDGVHSECAMLFSDSTNTDVEDILNPNIGWKEFKEKYDNLPDADNNLGDISPLMYFHTESFGGAETEKGFIFAVLHHLRIPSCDFQQFNEDCQVSISAEKIYAWKTYASSARETVNVPDKDKNNIAKAVIRLVTLGIIKDYEYDYSKEQYKISLGSINRENVLEKYLTFVDGCSRGRSEGEKQELEKVHGNDLSFIKAVVERYVDLVYETIEKGRRRAMHSMFRLAKDAVQIHDQTKQDAYIRAEIQSYLVKDDTVDIVKSSNDKAGIYEILRAYPLYPNDVNVDRIEQENAKSTSGYAARMLEQTPDHPGLLYLHAITSIKAGNYQGADVANDIIAAYNNSKRYSIPSEESTIFVIRVMNLAFNASESLFEILWNKVADLRIKNIAARTMELSDEYIGQKFKKHLLLCIATQSLQKMTGEKQK